MAALPRFYCPQQLVSGGSIELPAGAARHVQVLRMQPGDGLTLFNTGPGWAGPFAAGEFQATVTHMTRSAVVVQVGEQRVVAREAQRPVHLALGMPANERMDWLVEKAVELGVASIQPLLCERSVLRLQGERAEKKVAHWQAIAISACEQCGGNQVPVVYPVQPVAHCLQTAGLGHSRRLLLSLRADSQALRFLALDPGAAVQILSGPEGGLSPQEEDAALASGFQAASLGARVLRAETAALAALALLA